MYLQNFIQESTKRFKEPSMLLVTPPAAWRTQIHLGDLHVIKFPDEEILKMFSENPRTTAIVIDGLEAMDNILDLRAFIFSARKFFDSASLRPLIIIYTNYYEDEYMKIPSWGGLYSEILQYGNVYIKCGRASKKKHENLYFNEVLGIRLKKSEYVYAYLGHQYS